MDKIVPEENQIILNEITIFLREYRIQSGLTIQQLSELTTLHKNTIQRAETGHNISVLTLIEIANSLELPLKELFWDL
jgi:transcriptional regulator with XRE-family HTH domain